MASTGVPSYSHVICTACAHVLSTYHKSTRTGFHPATIQLAIHHRLLTVSHRTASDTNVRSRLVSSCGLRLRWRGFPRPSTLHFQFIKWLQSSGTYQTPRVLISDVTARSQTKRLTVSIIPTTDLHIKVLTPF